MFPPVSQLQCVPLCVCVCVFAPRLRSVASLIKSRRVLQNMYLVFFPFCSTLLTVTWDAVYLCHA